MMNEIDLKSSLRTAAGPIIDGLTVDADAVLADVYRRHRRYQRRRLVSQGAGVVAVAGLTAAAVTAGMTSTGDVTSTSDVFVPRVDEDVALPAYTVSATDDAPALATVDGLDLTYLPPGLPSEPSITSHNYESGTALRACFGDTDSGCLGSGLGVAVMRAPGLDLEGYLATIQVGELTETTVGERPAVASGILGDEASGLVWSPEDGVVVEAYIDSSMAEELRRVVDGARLR
jgi:hypothetical protein